MRNLNYESIMDILYDEFSIRLECAMNAKEQMKKTLNPFKRIKHYKAYKLLISDAACLELAMRRINLENRA